MFILAYSTQYWKVDNAIKYDLLSYTVFQENCAKLFFSELCQISTNCENFWHKDGKDDKLMWDALIFHFT